MIPKHYQNVIKQWIDFLLVFGLICNCLTSTYQLKKELFPTIAGNSTKQKHRHHGTKSEQREVSVSYRETYQNKSIPTDSVAVCQAQGITTQGNLLGTTRSRWFVSLELDSTSGLSR